MKRWAILAGLCLSLAFPAAARPAPLGRLFFTPEQRAILDRQRQLGFQTGDNSLTEDAVLAINGQVWRSSGHRTTWVNGHPFTEREALPLHLAALKPGESIHLASGKRTSLLPPLPAIPRPPPLENRMDIGSTGNRPQREGGRGHRHGGRQATKNRP